MSSPKTVCPSLGKLLDPETLRKGAASFEAMATDDAHPLPFSRDYCWCMVAALRFTANVIDSGEAWAGGHLVALEREMRGQS